MTLQCPICHVDFIREVLEDFEVHATRDQNNDSRVGGLQVLTCSNGHIFFIRKSDLCVQRGTGAAA